ncbi:MAG: SDR family NAD(P)-dependent oxidoreductase [Clostridiales bacterium]|nr:SDR family NAD(P)-dependent oxidoreductase [Clostridiales bacterium]
MKKVILITGASSGIGLTTAEFLSSKGYVVYGTARKPFENKNFKTIVADVNNHIEMENVFETVLKEEGQIDVVINNAGIGISGAIEYTKKQDIENIFNTNAIAVVDICSIAIKYLRKTKGKIINIGSVAGVVPLPFQACYSATKSAVENFSQALRNEVKDFGIKVTCIRPGDTKTGFTAARVKSEEKADDYNKRIQKSVSKMEKDEQNGMSALCVSKVIYKCIKKKNPALVKTVGCSYKFLCLLVKILPTRLVNFIIKKLYG